MTIFELVKVALDELYEECEKYYGKNVDKEVLKRIEYLSASYGDLTNPKRDPINYKDPATRFAYVYKYVAAHGDYIVQMLEKLRRLKKGPIFSNKTLRVSCIGGGPGSDIISVLKYLQENGDDEAVTKVNCYLLDREQAWADTWTELDDSLDINLQLNSNFQPFDITDESTWEQQKKFLKADLFTLSYFLSEVVYLKGGKLIEGFLGRLFDEAKAGAFFIYTDNGHNDFTELFDETYKKHGLKRLLGKENITFLLRNSEQSDELATYKKKFGFSPKIKAYISYRVVEKA